MATDSRPDLEEIRKKLGQYFIADTTREFLDCDTVPGGVPKGVLCEIVGTARTEWILRLLRQNPSLNIFWAEEKLTLFPTALEQRGFDLRRILIAETQGMLFQTLRRVLKSKVFDCVILPGTIQEVKKLKALQLFAREANAGVFFLSKYPKNAWSVLFQLEANWDSSCNSISVRLIKSKAKGANANEL